MNEPPDGIIITISRKMYGENGYRHWLRNFQEAMRKHEEDWYYWLRVGSKPILDDELSYVFLCIGNKIRFKGYYGGVVETPEGFKTFDDGRTIKGRFWCLISGPVTKAPNVIDRKGFQGFRYTTKLW